MKAKSIYYFVLIPGIILLTNCTIEKRVFQKGYHLEWKKKTPKSIPSETSVSLIESSPEQAQTKEKATMFSENDSLLPVEKTVIEKPEGNESPATSKSNSVTSTEKLPEPERIEQDPSDHQKKTPNQTDMDESDAKEVELFGVMSFSMYFASIVFTLMGILAFNSGYVVIAAAFLLVLALVFGIISVIRYRRNKERYRRNFFGYFGLIASMVTITLGGLFVLLAFLAGSF
ncbi:hypothetical protein [Fluviicola sp.]|uniref:hypothetical protein n=1 Tax=Fluviicola sp. TaxID=1917219 RepID=UPI00260BC42A|nr:hypothetical protein [Fluviicola sp.]